MQSRTSVRARALIAVITTGLLVAVGVGFSSPALADNPPISLSAPAPGTATATVQLPSDTVFAYGATVPYSVTVTCADPFDRGTPTIMIQSQYDFGFLSPSPSLPSSWDNGTYTGSTTIQMDTSTNPVSLFTFGASCFGNDFWVSPLETLTADPATKPAADAPWQQATIPTVNVGHEYDGFVQGPENDHYTSYAISGDVPGGMTLSSFGRIVWIPTTAGPVSFDVVATDAAGNEWTTTISTTVSPGLAWVKSSVAPFATGLSYSDYVTAPDYGSQYTFTYTLSGGVLPNGLAMSDAGVISGTPDDQLATYDYQITATDIANNVYVLDLSTELVAGPGPDSPWVNSTVPDLQYGHAMSVQLAGPANDTYTYAYAGVLPSGISLSSSGLISGSSQDEPGEYSLQVTATDPFGTQWVTVVTLTLGAEKPWVNTTLPNAIVGSPYSEQVIAPDYGLTYTYSFELFDYDHNQPNASRVQWLSYGDDGTIYGTPNISSTGTVIQVTATDSDGNVFTTLVTLETTGVPPIWSTSALPALYPGIPVSSSVSAGGDDVAYSVVTGTLPAGLTLNLDGTITGSALFTGPYDVTIRAERDGAHTDREFTGSVLEPSATLTLNFGVGDSDLTLGAGAAGLAPGSTWSLELHSTPTTIGSGVVAGDGTFFSTVTIPAGTPAGAHELILSGVSPSGAAVTAHAWFTLGRNGKILAISFTGPTPGLASLASTGAPDVSGAVLTGLLALIAGASLLLVRRRRRI